MNKVLRAASAVLALCLLARAAQATTYLVPSDRELIQRADQILVVTGIDSHARWNGRGGIETIHRVHVDEVIKGWTTPDSILEIIEIGGEVDNLGLAIPGSPRYQPARKYLAFTDVTRDYKVRTWGLGLGQFAFEKDEQQREVLVRPGICGFDQNFAPHVEPLRSTRFLQYVRDVVRNRVVNADYVLEASARPMSVHEWGTEANATASSYLMDNNARWDTASASFTMSGTAAPAVNAVGTTQNALATWTNDGGSSISYTYGGTTATIANFETYDGENVISWGDPNNYITQAGVLGVGGPWYSSGPGGTHTFAGETFNTIGGADVIIETTVTSQACADAVLAHELGHTLGFRHSDEGRATSSACPGTFDCAPVGAALMAHATSCSFSDLKTWDQSAAATVYGSGPAPCVNPAITTQPQDKTINEGASTTLSVAATGTSPTYQWYIGNAGTTSSPAPAGTSSTITVSPSSTTKYWVRVTACGVNADSTAATVTVIPAPCVPPSITTQPQSVSMSAGEAVALSVSATGTKLQYQWYRGQKDDTSAPVAGGSGASLTASPTTTTTYWVKVSNECGSASSEAVIVTVVPCATVAVNTPSVISIGSGAYQLSVTATGGTIASIDWYIGTTPGAAATYAGSGATVNVFPTEATSYWARAANSCGNMAYSSVVRIEPAGACTAPSITAVTANPTTVDSGANVTLTVTATGTSLAYQWYQGAPDVTTTPLANSNAASITVKPTATTTYWVRVSSGCGASPANSAGVTVTVNTCTKPAITTQPASVTIKGGEKATLTVVATGTGPLTYAWYEGAVGDTTKKVGSAATLTTDRLLLATKYWVRISNSCGTVDSTIATVSLIPARLRVVRR